MSDPRSVTALRQLVLAVGVDAVVSHCGVLPSVVYAWLYACAAPTDAEWDALAALMKRSSARGSQAGSMFADAEAPTRVQPRKMRPAHRVRTVIVVDDDRDHRMFVRRVLERHAYEVIEAQDGLEALEAVQQSSVLPELMLLDLKMPIMTGVSVLDALATRPTFAAMHVLILSATAPPASLTGYHSALLKPVDPAALIDVVTEVIGASVPRIRI